jgi:hypothetical protein
VSPVAGPLAINNVFVNDLIQLAQGQDRLKNCWRTLFHTLDEEVFRPLAPDDILTRKEPASEKKLKKGNGYWETRKIILG